MNCDVFDGDKIRNFRLKRGLTQEQLAEKAGNNNKYLSRIECGYCKPRVTIIEKLFNALEIKILLEEII